MFFNIRKKNKKAKLNQIDPDQILLDAKNLPGFNIDQFEGRIAKPVSVKIIFILQIFFLLVVVSFISRVFFLQIVEGDQNFELSEKNKLRQSIIFADRGIIYDSKNIPLAWNEPTKDGQDFSQRKYIDSIGFGKLLGYVDYPKKDSSGFYYSKDILGIEGIEFIYNDLLKGQNGSKIIETNSIGEVVDDATIRRPIPGNDIRLTIDYEMQSMLAQAMQKSIDQFGFTGGAGVMMDVNTGDLLTYVNLPEYNPEILSIGSDKESISNFFNNPNNPFLDRVSRGLYTPGSIVKPFVALAALEENLISPYKIINTKGFISIPNPYNPDNPSLFNDWKNHGPINMKDAIAVSSNVYFYIVGGGFEEQKGLGIETLNKYLSMFSFGQTIQTSEFTSLPGVVPNPEWKRKVFNDAWRVGDTYFTSIGQYGFQVTPLQMVTSVAALANKGTLLSPRLFSNGMTPPQIIRQLEFDDDNYKIVEEGMRGAVLNGSARRLNFPELEIAAKTGTAELGITKENVNSWIVGYYPLNNPEVAFAIVLEKGSVKNLLASAVAAQEFFKWLIEKDKPKEN